MPITEIGNSADNIQRQSVPAEERNETVYTNKTKPDRWAVILEFVMAAATLALAILGVITARAAWLNARAIINSERARIDGELTKEKIPGRGIARYSIRVANCGKTPAKILGYAIKGRFLNDDIDFSEPGMIDRPFADVYVLVPGGKSETLRSDLSMDELFPNTKNAPMIALRVIISYLDVINPGIKKRKHKTSMVYLYTAPIETLKRMTEYDEYDAD
ncbi:MAG TPA: hypothetical protein VN785_03960 [Candidatus Angelobacter sp.]|nr:hypothetical protein [Candidatus Angelobacter sp.]